MNTSTRTTAIVACAALTLLGAAPRPAEAVPPRTIVQSAQPVRTKVSYFSHNEQGRPADARLADLVAAMTTTTAVPPPGRPAGPLPVSPGVGAGGSTIPPLPNLGGTAVPTGAAPGRAVPAPGAGVLLLAAAALAGRRRRPTARA